MEYPVKVRIELGLGIPSEMQPLKEPDGFKAMIRALAEILTLGDIPANFVAEGKSGSVTAHATPQRFSVRIESPGALPPTFIHEMEATVHLKK